jgi:hypothetical protein
MWKRMTAGLGVGLVAAGVAIWASPNAAALVADGGRAPEISGSGWINSEPLSLERLRGRVVLVEFWTYG